jgi:hypothetical protein
MTTRKTSAARAAASRRNGVSSRGPRTAAGKARVARNALKHGLAARQTVTLEGEDAAAFADLEQALHAELMPVGALQGELVARIASATWRARRVDRLEAALLGRHLPAGATGPDAEAALGTGLIRDGHGPRALETLVRYRGSVLAELFRALGALRVLQADASDAEALPLLPVSSGPKTKQTREPRPRQRLGSRA